MKILFGAIRKIKDFELLFQVYLIIRHLFIEIEGVSLVYKGKCEYLEIVDI